MDAHGGEQYVTGMWTAEIAKDSEADLYEECLAAIRPLLTELEYRRLNDPAALSVELCDLPADGACVANLTAALDESGSDSVRFSWRLIRNNLSACVVLVSARRIVIRPVLAPTHTHEEFASARQRLLMSATLGDPADLMREYSLDTLVTLKAENPQWGHRYIFVPEMHATESVAAQIVSEVWNRLEPQRSVLLTPSAVVLERVFDRLCEGMNDTPSRLSASDIVDSLAAFTKSEGVVLTVAGRYDGLDFPDDDCRLLIMAEAPSAISDLERHLRDYWKLGPLMRRRELTRLLQGLGRCTRSATDYSIVFWLGQSLVNAAAHTGLLRGLPKEVATELRWGVAQSKLAGENPRSIVNMALSLLTDESYRLQANESLNDYQVEGGEESPLLEIDEVRKEVLFSRAMWGQDFGGAYDLARKIADQARDSGYRSWWWYLASTAARYLGEQEAEADCLRRAIGCGINSGWIRRVAERRGRGRPQPPDDCWNTEGVWNHIEWLGWAGPKFRRELSAMGGLLEQTDHKQFHDGLERLGRCLGAQTTRTNEQGAPDVVWSLEDDVHIAFEAKTEKTAESVLSKEDVLQAGGHVNWVKDKLANDHESARIVSVIVSPTSSLHDTARPHVADVYWIRPEIMNDLGRTVDAVLSELRTSFSGSDFGQVKDELCAKLKLSSLHLDGVIEFLTKDAIADQ